MEPPDPLGLMVPMELRVPQGQMVLTELLVLTGLMVPMVLKDLREPQHHFRWAHLTILAPYPFRKSRRAD